MTDFYRVFHDLRPAENGIIVAYDGARDYAYVANTGLWHRNSHAGTIVLVGHENYSRTLLSVEEVYERLGQCRPIWNQGFSAEVLREHRLQPDHEKRTSADLGLDPARVPPLAEDAWRRLPLVDDDPFPAHQSITEVWKQESQGLDWSGCGHRPLTLELLTDIGEEIVAAPVPEDLTHNDVTAILQALWGLETVCHYFRAALATAARRVHGSTSVTYDRSTALAIAKDFSDRWDGCPDEAL